MSSSTPPGALSKPTVAIIGFLDTKGAENAFAAELLKEKGCEVVLIDVSIADRPYEHARFATHTPSSIAQKAGTPLDLRTMPRTEALSLLTSGTSGLLQDLHDHQALHAVFACGGSTTSALACDAMRALPIGLPKVCVSTMVCGDVSSYVGESDVCLMPAIVDLPGKLNPLSEKILGNAVAAVAGMAHAYRSSSIQEGERERKAPNKKKKTIALTMFGVTTPGVMLACDKLAAFKDANGESLYETVVFHCTGAGGRSMERLIREKWFDGVLDLTTTELVDEECGGVLSAGPTRLTAAGECSVPQVVSLGALDMCNFGPKETVPEKYRERKLHVHNPSVTLVRTVPAECATIGRLIGKKLRAAQGPTGLVIPKKGFSMLDAEGGPYWDPEADAALVHAAKKALEGSNVDVKEVESGINEEALVEEMVQMLHAFVSKQQ